MNIIYELFLNEYFLIEGILGDHLTDKKKLFTSLGEIFFLNNDELEKLYSVVNTDIITNISSKDDYMRHQRIVEFYHNLGEKIVEDEITYKILQIKGSAFNLDQNSILKLYSNDSKNSVYKSILNASNMGEVLALRILGILEVFGIFVSKDFEGGIKKLTKASRWNDLISTLVLSRIDIKNKKEHLSRLYMLVNDGPYSKLYEKLVENSPAKIKIIKEVELLEKAFNLMVLKKEQYDENYARIIYSNILSNKDKEMVIFTTNKELPLVVSMLPVKIEKAKGKRYKLDSFKNSLLNRPLEQLKIIKNINDFNNAKEKHLPLCIYAEDGYLLDSYKNMISSLFIKNHLIDINVVDLTEYDLSLTQNNIIIRNIDEEKQNIALMSFIGDINQNAIDNLKNFIKNDRRKHLFLSNLGISIDLCSVMPICFVDKNNVENFEGICEIINIESINQVEKKKIVNEMINNYKKIYHLNKLSFASSVYETFEDINTSNLEQIINEIFLILSRQEFKDSYTLTSVDINDYVKKYIRKETTFGFGGIKNEYR